ncbi:MAG: hypothetical protein MI746_12160 [Pseudomonadales bacterium]|nr:hypothetical protein [Pseudomonadales bacterium]
MNLENLVTKDFLTAKFAEQSANIETRLAEFKAEFDTKFQVIVVMLSIVMAAVVIPLLERVLV